MRLLSLLIKTVLFTVIISILIPQMDSVREATIRVVKRDLRRIETWLRGGEDKGARISIKVRSPQSYNEIIKQASAMWGVDPAFIKAVIMTESAFDPDAVSRAGAMGLMQLMPETAADLGVDDPFNPRDNIFGGSRLLSEYLDRYGTVRKTLIAYNAGPKYVGRRRLPAETRRYIKVVQYFYRIYSEEM